MTGRSWRTTRDPPGSLTGLVAGGVTVLVLATAFGLSALDLSWAWVVYPLGFGGLLPLALGAAGRYGRRERPDRCRDTEARTTETGDGPAMEALRGRYARGEIDEVEFERRVERLLRTETVADAREYLDGPDR